jgi:L-fuconolactonase
MLVDAHHHFWTVARGDYHWLAGAPKILHRDYLAAEFVLLIRRFGISKTILVQAAATVAETEFLLDIADVTSSVSGVVGWLDFESDAFEATLTKLMERPKLVGLRPMLQDLDDDHYILRPRVLRNLQVLAETGLCFDILTFPRHLKSVAAMLSQVKNLRAVVDHLSKPAIASGALEPWRADISRIADFENVHCKISGMVTEADPLAWSVADLKPFVHHVAACFGKERLMFGSDWPVCTVAASYAEVLASTILALPPEIGFDSGVFGRNALAFYRISPD